MRSKSQRKVKRSFNKFIERINLILEKDEEFKGRFSVKQHSFLMRDFQNKRGFYIELVLYFVDNKTNTEYKEYIYSFNQGYYRFKIVWDLHDFICKQKECL